jgi:glycosyltransferase involved in cell wall biosynthesis
MQYLPYLKAFGIQVSVCPFFSDAYIDGLYHQRRRSYAELAKSYVKRLYHFARSASYDLIWLQTELFPWLPAWGETLLAGLGIPYVVDYDDAIFHKYDLHQNVALQTLFRFKIDTIMRRASLVIVGNPYLASRATRAGAKRVEEMPTVVEVSRYSIAPKGNNASFTIGWIGSPGTSHYLQQLQPTLSRFCEAKSAHLFAVGALGLEMENVPLFTKRWSEQTEAADLCRFDLGVMPLPDGPWERGKCGLKLIQYMAAGLPVVASPVGVNSHIVKNGVTGYLASSQDEWMAAFDELSESRSLCEAMGEAGRKVAEECYSVEKTAPRLAVLLQSAIGNSVASVMMQQPLVDGVTLRTIQ